MTIILFVYDEHTLSVYTDPAPPDQVAEAINTGRSSLDPGWIPGCRWHAVCQADLVLVTAVPQDKPVSPGEVIQLSPREYDTLVGLAAGLSIKQIAASLGLQPRTITQYTWSIKRKLGARTREQTVIRAMSMGLVNPKDLPKK